MWGAPFCCIVSFSSLTGKSGRGKCDSQAKEIIMERDLTYCKIQYHAQVLASAAVCAYWDEDRRAMHKKDVIDAMKKINELMELLK